MKTLLLASVIAFEILVGEERAEAQLIQVTIAPPSPRVESMPPSPGSGHAWVAGYWAWNGARYVWTPGHWERPPRTMDVWQPPRWDHGQRAWGFTQGRWISPGRREDPMPPPPAVMVAPRRPDVGPMPPPPPPQPPPFRGRGGRRGDERGGGHGGRGRH